jgi:tRNA/rRNA methyltransferase
LSDSGSGVLPGREGIRVVLLGPRRGANVGAACRAIKNMGGGGLVVVGGCFDADEARRTAVHADDVFASRIEVATLEEAVASCRLVIGTTSRRDPWSIPVEGIEVVLADARRGGLEASSIALVFGPEDRGLANEELARCHRVATIETADDYDSLNLAQAVVVCLYEWRRSGAAAVPSAREEERDVRLPANAGQQAEALADLRRVLEEIGFLHGDQADRVMASVASMLTRGGLDDRELRILRGIVRQVRWAARVPATAPAQTSARNEDP